MDRTIQAYQTELWLTDTYIYVYLCMENSFLDRCFVQPCMDNSKLTMNLSVCYSRIDVSDEKLISPSKPRHLELKNALGTSTYSISIPSLPSNQNPQWG